MPLCRLITLSLPCQLGLDLVHGDIHPTTIPRRVEPGLYYLSQGSRSSRSIYTLSWISGEQIIICMVDRVSLSSLCYPFHGSKSEYFTHAFIIHPEGGDYTQHGRFSQLPRWGSYVPKNGATAIYFFHFLFTDNFWPNTYRPTPLPFKAWPKLASSELGATLASNPHLDHFGFYHEHSTFYPQPWQLSWSKKDNYSVTSALTPIFITIVPATKREALFTSKFASNSPPASVTRYSDLPVPVLWMYQK